MRYLFIFIVLFSKAWAQKDTEPTSVETDFSADGANGESIIISTAAAQDDTESSTEETISTTVNPVNFLSDEALQFIWSPKSEDFIIVEADESYEIAVNITDCNIDGANGEYATISTDDLTYGITFTYAVTGKPSYLYNTNRLYGNFYGTNASNFTAIFTRVGEPDPTTSTDISTTTISLPIPDVNVTSTLRIFLKGNRTHDFFSDGALGLREVIAAMAVEYCNNTFFLCEEITVSNVLIKNLVHCPLNWPDANICTDITFAVPVELLEDDESEWTGYQLTAEHLQIMWLRYAEDLLPDGITIYYPPNLSSLKWGLITASIVIVVFAMALIIIRYIVIKVTKRRRRDTSDTTSIISRSDRYSEDSMPPHHMQEMPKLFENDYRMYNPNPATAGVTMEN